MEVSGAKDSYLAKGRVGSGLVCQGGQGHHRDSYSVRRLCAKCASFHTFPGIDLQIPREQIQDGLNWAAERKPNHIKKQDHIST